MSVATFVFTDIEGSTRLWEQSPEAMRRALAWHDGVSAAAVAAHHGRIVKSTGDGIHAVFEDPADAVAAVLALQQALQQAASAGTGTGAADGELRLRVRAALHGGESEHRDGDYFGPVLNRSARLMAAAHGEQVLLSRHLAAQVQDRLPPGATLRDLGRVRLRDLAEPEHVHQLLHPALRSEFPPLRSLEATPNNLARQLDTFVGREQELAELRGQLREHRLLTLLGMGGIGKSRLSVQLGADLLDDYPDGVWLVELAPLADPQLVPQALAGVLGVKEQPGRPPMQALLDHVRDKTLLVILDNCEHLVAACALLAKQLLQHAGGVRVLASSRDALQVAGETIYAVPALAVPAPEGPGAAAPPAQPPAQPPVQLPALPAAVQLFVDRARAVQPQFRLDAGNAAAVAEICRRLDGIPLALELAAARTRALPVQVIAARLNDRFRLLVSGDRTLQPRQRTLRALIDWSFELLSEPERVLYRRLAVFAGGWTLAAAEAVCADEGLPPAEVLDLLAQLVGKSLVVMEPESGRYRMLETVRAYALEQLAEAGDESPTRRRHVAQNVALAEHWRARLAGPEQAQALAALDLERDNLLAAHAWCGADPDCLEPGLRLVFLLKIYWHLRGLLDLGLRITEEALARTRPDQRDFLRCRVLCDAGQLAYYGGHYERARRHLLESHAIARELDDGERLSAVLPPLGLVLVANREPEAALPVYEAAVELATALGRERQRTVALNSLAQLHRAQGRLGRAEALFEQVISQCESLEDPEGLAVARLNLAMTCIAADKAQRAVPLLRQVQQAVRDTQSQPLRQSLLDISAGFCAGTGYPSSAAWLYGAAEAHAERTGIRREPDDEAFLAPHLESVRRSLGDADFAAISQRGRSATDAEVATRLDAALAPD